MQCQWCGSRCEYMEQIVSMTPAVSNFKLCITLFSQAMPPEISSLIAENEVVGDSKDNEICFFVRFLLFLFYSRYCILITNFPNSAFLLSSSSFLLSPHWPLCYLAGLYQKVRTNKKLVPGRIICTLTHLGRKSLLNYSRS